MAVLKFRVYLEEDDAVYRDICIKHTQTFAELHYAILKAYVFDTKHQATFYRSNDKWLQGREISFEVYDKKYVAPPLLMADTAIGTEIINTNQKFVYEYDFAKGWLFLIELIHVSKETDASLTYPLVTRTEGIGPQQYGTKSLLGNKFADIEEKYDLSEAADGFGEEGDEEDNGSDDADDDVVDTQDEYGQDEY
jgi:hypothetical protein